MSGTATTCPECQGALRRDGDETVCGACGLVVAADRLDRGPEWRAFDDESRERTGAPLTRSRHDRGLSTEIGHGGRLTGRKRRRFARLRRHHNRSQVGSKVDRNRVYAFTEIRRVADRLGIPDDTRDRACVLFERAQDADLLRGRSLEGFAAACLYAACRANGLSRTIAELTEVTRASDDELTAAYDAMNRDLGLPIAPSDPREFLPRFANELDLPVAVERRGAELLDDLDPTHCNGRNPGGVAAACLYAAADERDYPLTQAEAAEAADVTPVTLRATYAALE